MTRRIVVLGGTGFVGLAVCEALVRAHPGWRIVVPTRHARFGLPQQALPGVELVTADVNNADAMRKVLVRADAVVNLIAVLHGSFATFERTHVALPQLLAKTCHDLGIQRIVHLSALGASEGAPSIYLRTKAGGEEALLAPGPVNAAILRPSAIFGAHDRFLNLFARLQRWAPVMPLAGADARLQPVWVEDVARAVLRCVEDPSAAGRIIECCGPKVYTLGELVQLAGRLAGHPRPLIKLPMALGQLQAMFLEAMPGQPLLSTDSLDSLRIPNVATEGAAGLASLGIEPAALEAVAPLYLSPGQAEARLDRWRAAR
jgi:NADH dehydrogenase